MSNIHGIKDHNKDYDRDEYEAFTSSGYSSSTLQLKRKTREDGGASLLDTVLLNAKAQYAQGQTNKQSVGVVTLYKDGFVLGEGEFRSLEDPQNKQFLESMLQGELPAELESDAKKAWGEDITQVSLSLVDKRKENYHKQGEQKKGFDFEKSQGRSLGGGGGDSKENPFAEVTAQQLGAVGPGEKAVRMQLVLPDRRKVKLQCSANTTLRQLYAHALHLVGGDATAVRMKSGVPPKPLLDPGQTVGQAGLAGARVAVTTIDA